MSPRRDNSARRREFRRESESILVLCAGKRTEADYLEGLRRQRRRAGLKIVRKGLDPTSLVNYGRRIIAQETGRWDEVWCVVDVDQYDLDSAERTAGSTIALAVSNPCFEVWLLLHYEDVAAYVDGYEDAERRLSRHLPAYDKSRLEFTDFAAGVGAAVKRAQLLHDGAVTGPNPSSGVWRLVEKIVRDTG